MRRPVDLARDCLAGVTAPRIALVTRQDRPGLVDRLVAACPGATVETIDLREGMPATHLALTVGRPWHLVLDLARGRGAARRWPGLLHQLVPGGTLAVALPGRARPLEKSVARVRAAQAQDVAAPTPGRDPRDNRERDLAALAASAGDLRIEDGWLLATNRVATLAKVPEADLDRFLDLRPAVGRVLATVPGQRFDSRCELRASGPVDLPASYDAPPVSLREYDDVTCLPRQAAYGDGLVLPESYRHHFKRRLRNVAFAEWAPRFVREPERPAALLDGTYFHLDSYVRGHFGHALTEQVAHLWGWAPALERHPDLRALVFAPPGQSLATWEWDLLGAAGIEAARVTVAPGPTRVERLVTTSPMFGMPAFVHPAIAETYAALGAALDTRAGSDAAYRRLFCSRRPGKRSCHNAGEVEELFADHDFTIVFPEDHPLPDQVRMVRRADVVAGFAGSGMFQIAFAGEPKHVILVGSESYTASNEYLISSAVGHRLDLVLCRPDVPRTGRGFSNRSYQSDFTFDPDREGVFLREVLAGL